MAPPGSGLTLYPDLLDPPPATSTSGTDPSAPEKVESPAKNAATDKAAAGKPQFNAGNSSPRLLFDFIVLSNLSSLQNTAFADSPF